MRIVLAVVAILVMALFVTSCAKERPRPKYGDPCDAGRGCFYLGDEPFAVPVIEIFDTDATTTNGD